MEKERWDIISRADGSLLVFLYANPGQKPVLSKGYLAHNPRTGEVILGVDNPLELL